MTELHPIQLDPCSSTEADGRHPQTKYRSDARQSPMRGKDADGCQLSLTRRG